MLEDLQVLRRTEWLHKHLQSRRIVRCHSLLSDIPAEDLAGRVVLRAFCKGKHLRGIHTNAVAFLRLEIPVFFAPGTDGFRAELPIQCCFGPIIVKSKPAGRPAEPLRGSFQAAAVAPHLCGYPV